MKKAVLITGANGGIGQALVNSFSQEGYRIIAIDRQKEFLHQEIGEIIYCQLDLKQLISNAKVRSKFKAYISELVAAGGLNAVVNNAAVQMTGNIPNIKFVEWQETIDVNLTAPFLLSQILYEEIVLGEGSIINITSVHSLLTKKGFVGYATSKAALSGFTRALAIELGGVVRVNSICPGATKTSMLLEGFGGEVDKLNELAAFQPAGTIVEPVDVAEAAVFLASEKASMITGAEIVVDGGIRCRLHDPD